MFPQTTLNLIQDGRDSLNIACKGKFRAEVFRNIFLQQVNVTVVRSQGYYGHIHLWYRTLNGTAVEGMDFAVTSGQLTFEPNETIKTINTEIFDDEIPEGPEEFSVEITKVVLVGR